MHQQTSPAQFSLSEVMGMTNHKVTALEASLWNRLIETYGDDAILAFLSDHVLNGTGFAPRPSDAQKMLNPGNSDSQVAFSELVRAVKTVGPYATPAALNESPVLVAAVHHLGGWAHICNTMPDAIGNRFEFDGFQKQFDAAFRLAASRVKIHGEQPKPLLGAVKAALQVTWVPPDAPAALIEAHARRVNGQAANASSDQPQASPFMTVDEAVDLVDKVRPFIIMGSDVHQVAESDDGERVRQSVEGRGA